MITIQQHNGINVVRDDLLPGGTKSILMPEIIGDANEYVYASPVYGGFQIALSLYCKAVNKKATIFCAMRGKRHHNTHLCKLAGAKIMEVPHGYLTNVEAKAKQYSKETGAVKIVFGAQKPEYKNIIANRVSEAIKQLGKEPDEIFCAIGSGTLVESILQATTTATVTGVIVGKEYNKQHPRLKTIKYNLSFDKPSHYKKSFPSMPNYDLKAWEYCNLKRNKEKSCLFWNVL